MQAKYRKNWKVNFYDFSVLKTGIRNPLENSPIFLIISEFQLENTKKSLKYTVL